ncbi:MAG: hypothetical protein ACT4PV_06275 [Planctomycetaceae bacterium]
MTARWLTSRRLAAAALLAGMALRFGAALRDDELRDDEKLRYVPVAESLRRGEGFALEGRATAQCMPLWPLALSVMPRGLEPRLLNALFSTACLPLAWLLAGRLAGTRVALAVLAALALDLDHVALAGSLLTEPLFTLLVLLFSLAWVEGRILRAAAVCGLAALVRPEAAIFPIALALFTRRWRPAGLVLAGVLLAVTPWAVRNARAFGAFVPFTTSGGITLVAGMNPGEMSLPFRKMGQGRGPNWKESLAMAPVRDEVEDDRQLARQAIDYALSHPGPALTITAAKAVLLWSPMQRKVTSIVYAAAVILAWWAMARGVRLALPLVAPLLTVMTLVGLLFLAIPRYRAPYHPYLFLLAAAGVVREPRRPDSVESPGRSTP